MPLNTGPLTNSLLWMLSEPILMALAPTGTLARNETLWGQKSAKSAKCTAFHQIQKIGYRSQKIGMVIKMNWMDVRGEKIDLMGGSNIMTDIMLMGLISYLT